MDTSGKTKKVWIQISALVLLVILLCVIYLATPIRPLLAERAANKYIQSHYDQYSLPPAQILATSHTDRGHFTWITQYGAQSYTDDHLIAVQLNGWLPWIVDDCIFWEKQDGQLVQVAD